MAPPTYFTLRKDVPLKAGQTVGFTRGKGYYAKTAAKAAPKKAPVKRTPKPVKIIPVAGPTSNAPKQTKTPSKKLARLKIAVAKARHAVNPSLPAKRKLVVAFWHWAIANNALIHYEEIRPVPRVTPGKLPLLPFTTDCSGLTTMSYGFAGLPDPNGLNYDGEGNTATLLAHGHETSVPQPGDIGIFGENPTHHAVVALVAGANPAVGSHGSEIGPLDILASVEQQYQPTPLTWLDMGALLKAAS